LHVLAYLDKVRSMLKSGTLLCVKQFLAAFLPTIRSTRDYTCRLPNVPFTKISEWPWNKFMLPSSCARTRMLAEIKAVVATTQIDAADVMYIQVLHT
jgi:hypothetical protein